MLAMARMDLMATCQLSLIVVLEIWKRSVEAISEVLTTVSIGLVSFLRMRRLGSLSRRLSNC